MTNPTVPDAPPRPQTGSSPPVPEVSDALVDALSACRGRDELYRTALPLIAARFDSPYAAIRVEKSSGSLEQACAASESASAAWRRPGEALLLDARYHRLAKARLYDAQGIDASFAALAAPIAEGAQGIVGSLVIFTPCQTLPAAELLLRELNALCSLIGVMSAGLDTRVAPGGSSAGEFTAGLAKAAEYENLHEFAFAIANNLAAKLGCEQVALGLVKQHRARVLCISGFDDLYPRSPGARLIEQAMSECYDAQVTICQQTGRKLGASQVSSDHFLHRTWHRETSNSAVASIPLILDGRTIAVLSMRRPSNRPFSADQLDKVRELTTPLAPGLLLLEKASKGIARHILDSAHVRATHFFRSGGYGKRLAAVVGCALVAWMVCGRCEYVVSVPCHLAPTVTRDISMPFEGTLAASFVKPGDQVQAGELLATLDRRKLTAEREGILAELQIANVSLARAASEKNLAAAAQSQAQVEIAESHLKVIDDQLQRAEIRAPAAGQILTGDLRSRVGEVITVGERLIEFAPLGSWMVELQIPEYAAPYVSPGQLGSFATNARPDESSACRLLRLQPSTEVAGGRNVFTGEASLDATPPEWVRAGMEGIARIRTEERPIWWVWLHRVIDSIRLKLWRL